MERYRIILVSFLLVLLHVSVSYAGIAEKITVKSELKNEESFYNLSGSPMNPDNIMELPTFESISLLFIEPKAIISENSFLKGLFSGEYLWQKNADNREETDIEVKELYFSKAYSGLSFDIGREKVRWGVGYSVSPTDIVTSIRRPDDPDDRLNRAEGTDLVKVDYLYGDSSFSFVYIPEIKYNAPEIDSQALAARYYTFIHGMDLSGVILIEENQKTKAGFNSSYVMGDALELHGEFLWSRKNESLCPDYSHGTDTLYTESPYKVCNDPAYFLLLGGQYTFDFEEKGTLNIVSEYYRNGNGMSADEIEDYINHIKFSGDLPRRQGYYQLQRASGIHRFPLGRDYLFLRFDYLFFNNRLRAELNNVYSLTDGSVFSQPVLTWDVNDNLSLYARGVYNYGDENSEAYIAPIDTVFSAGGSYNF